MTQPFTKRLGESSISLKYASFWRSVLGFGLPSVLLFRGVDYVIFRLTTRGIRWPYPTPFELMMDIAGVFFVSTLWWLLMREIAAWKRRSQNPSAANPEPDHH